MRLSPEQSQATGARSPRTLRFKIRGGTPLQPPRLLAGNGFYKGIVENATFTGFRLRLMVGSGKWKRFIT